MLSNFLVWFYRFWHTRLQLPGAGMLLGICAPHLPRLQSYPIDVPGFGLMAIDLSDVSGGAWLNFSLDEKTQEEGLIRSLRPYVTDNSVVWDIGANAGYFAAALLLRYSKIRELHLFEPNSALYPILEQLPRLDTRVKLHYIALSNESAVMSFYIPKRQSTLASLNHTENARRIEVECQVGDEYKRERNLSYPNIIIIDTEGSESSVLVGLKTTIQEARPIIVTENIFTHQSDQKHFIPDNYVNFVIEDTSGKLRDQNSSSGHNSIFIPRERFMINEAT